MIFCEGVLSVDELNKIKNDFGLYVKVTVDLEKGLMVIGPELHSDALPVLKEKGSLEEDVWGGWIDFPNNTIEMSAVLNIRPLYNNNGMELIGEERRKKFVAVVKKYIPNVNGQ